MDPSLVTVYDAPFPKKRIGCSSDGGYIICDIPDIQYDYFLSAGVDNNISFEEHFCSLYPNVLCKAHDGTIAGIRIQNSNITFIRKNIGPVETDSETNLHAYLSDYKTVFLKMDIEGAEIPWFLSLSDDHMNHMAQMVIEFHTPFSEADARVFEKITKTHTLVHFHANNFGYLRYHKGVPIPEVFECTFLHNAYFSGPPVPNRSPLPTPLDAQNTMALPDVILTYEPFVHGQPPVDVESAYQTLCRTPSDVNEHIPFVVDLASTCESILQCGGTLGIPFVYALSKNGGAKKTLCWIKDFCERNPVTYLYAKQVGVDYSCRVGNLLQMSYSTKYDLVYIDTWHVYGQLIRELALLAPIAKKYIVLRCTETDKVYGTALRCGQNIMELHRKTGFPPEEIVRGTQFAIDEFLEKHPEWSVRNVFTHNHGLIVLERVNS